MNWRVNMEGWIKLHRKIKDHWLYKESRVFSKFEAWTDILLEVNHSTDKVLIGENLMNVKPGESLKSLDTWSRRWNWNKSKVRRFLKLLENDNMIELKNERKTTRITICKYERYQVERNANETQVKRKRNASETQVTPDKNVKNVKNEKNVKKREGKKIPPPPSISEFVNYAKDKAFEKNLNLDTTKLELKFEAWKENEWRTGKGQKINNWKTTLLNTLPYLQKEKNSAKKENYGKGNERTASDWARDKFREAGIDYPQ